jgi:hypothetical protein
MASRWSGHSFLALELQDGIDAAFGVVQVASEDLAGDGPSVRSDAVDWSLRRKRRCFGASRAPDAGPAVGGPSAGPSAGEPTEIPELFAFAWDDHCEDKCTSLCQLVFFYVVFSASGVLLGSKCCSQ